MAYEGIKFVTDDADWGTGTGTPLPAADIDRNFFTLAEKVKSLQDDPPTAVDISNIVVVGRQFKIYLSDGTEFGPYNLPIAQFNWRSEWFPDVDYLELDLVTVKGQGLFVVTTNHHSASTFDPNAVDGGGHIIYQKVFGEDVYVYNIGFFYPGKPGTGLVAGDMILAHLFNESVYLLESSVDTAYFAKLATAPAADMEFAIFKNGTEIGSVAFALGEQDGAITITATTQFEAGDVLYVQYPDDGIDADARHLTITMRGLRGTV